MSRRLPTPGRDGSAAGLLAAVVVLLVAVSAPAAALSGGGPAHVRGRDRGAAHGRAPRAHAARVAAAQIAGDALLRHGLPREGGLAWRSAIQHPHLQSDRDVGAASVAAGLLAVHDVTDGQAYLTGARRAGDWLLRIAQRTPDGLRWPDYHDDEGPSDTFFTSFDDGAPGIADLLWRLGRATGDPHYRDAAVSGMRWAASKARGAGGLPCPLRCRWPYYEDARDDVRTGMGEGMAGIAWAFDAFAQRLHDPRMEAYATGTAAELESFIDAHGAVPERPGRDGYDTGFLSGSAGDAFLFLTLHEHTGDARWLRDAERLLTWLRRHAIHTRGGLAWPIEVGREERDPTRATGMEEGAAGIGWVFLQAWRHTGNRADLDVARAAGRWLLTQARHEHRGLAWPEDAGGTVVHTGLNNGTAGIGWFLDDLARATGSRPAARAAGAAEHWLLTVATRDGRGTIWHEYRDERGWHLAGEPSWHWGAAGIAAFFARRAGWAVDMPGEEPGLPCRSCPGAAAPQGALNRLQ